jgi:hypothetical protein
MTEPPGTAPDNPNNRRIPRPGPSPAPPPSPPTHSMSLRIYNTLSRALEDFSPLEPGHVRMYVCGITVYDLCHIGHARSADGV